MRFEQTAEAFPPEGAGPYPTGCIRLLQPNCFPPWPHRFRFTAPAAIRLAALSDPSGVNSGSDERITYVNLSGTRLPNGLDQGKGLVCPKAMFA